MPINRKERQESNTEIIKMVRVESSNIESIGRKGMNTYVKYIKTGETYLFEQMPHEQYCEIMEAESIGKALHATGIKGVKVLGAKVIS